MMEKKWMFQSLLAASKRYAIGKIVVVSGVDG